MLAESCWETLFNTFKRIEGYRLVYSYWEVLDQGDIQCKNIQYCR